MLRDRIHARARHGAVAAAAATAVAAVLGGCGGGSVDRAAGEGNGAATATPASTTTPPATTTTTSATTTARTNGARSAVRHTRSRVRTPTLTAAAVLGRRTKTAGCQVRGPLPDAACTPGGVFPNATVAQICQPGYSQRVRDVLPSTKDAVYAAYGITSHTARQYEIDHLVPLEVGGNNTRANLWPEIAPGFGEKDAVENELHAAVCSGRVPLATAQARIAHDWRHAGVPVPASSGTPATPSPPASATTPSGFCATHRCIASFSTGRGSIVQCADGEYSHSGGLPGVCSRHGGPR